MTLLKTISILAVAAVSASAASASTYGTRSTAYSLGNGGTSLVTLASPSGMGASALTLNFDGAPAPLNGIAYRPQTGQLYGYSDASDSVYLIDTKTGQATTVVSNLGITNDNDLGFDFNNQIDAARIVTGQNENVVFFIDPARRATAPELVKFTDLAYAPTDPNSAQNPNVVMNAYTNAVPNATTTLQYVIDTDLDSLATLANNTGVLTTVGALYYMGSAFDVTEFGGLDILSFEEGDNTAFALFSDNTGLQSIFEVPLFSEDGRININLISDATTSFGTLNGFAVAPSAVPLPAAGLLLFGALGGVAALRRRRKTV